MTSRKIEYLQIREVIQAYHTLRHYFRIIAFLYTNTWLKNDIYVTKIMQKPKYSQCVKGPRVINLTFIKILTLRPGLRRRTLSAAGTTIRFFLSKGDGIPSQHWSLLRASFPRSVLCGTMPRTVRQKIFEGARKWNGPRAGLTLHRLRKNWK